jgi:hypothetical protein
MLDVLIFGGGGLLLVALVGFLIFRMMKRPED